MCVKRSPFKSRMSAVGVFVRLWLGAEKAAELIARGLCLVVAAGAIGAGFNFEVGAEVGVFFVDDFFGVLFAAGAGEAGIVEFAQPADMQVGAALGAFGQAAEGLRQFG